MINVTHRSVLCHGQAVSFKRKVQGPAARDSPLIVSRRLRSKVMAATQPGTSLGASALWLVYALPVFRFV